MNYTIWPILFFIFACTSCKKELAGQNQLNAPAKLFDPTFVGVWPIPKDNSPKLSLGISDAFAGNFNADEFERGLSPIEQMMTTWNNAQGDLSFFILPAKVIPNLETTNLDDYKDTTFGIYKSFSWFDEVSEHALAITQFYGKRVGSPPNDYLEMHHADIIINYKNYDFSSNQNSIEDYDIVSVVLHELGHFVGVGHYQGNESSVMAPYLARYESYRKLFEVDKTILAKNYLKHNLALTSSSRSGIVSSSMTTDHSVSPGQEFRGIIEVMPDGSCEVKIEALTEKK